MEHLTQPLVAVAGFDWQSFLPALLMFLASYFGGRVGSRKDQ